VVGELSAGGVAFRAVSVVATLVCRLPDGRFTNAKHAGQRLRLSGGNNHGA
jgi:hypothetical protein